MTTTPSDNNSSHIDSEVEEELDALITVPLEELPTEEELLKSLHTLEQEDIQKKINTDARQLFAENPEGRNVYFKPFRPKMIPIPGKDRPIADNEGSTVGVKSAELIYGDRVPLDIRTGIIRRWNNQVRLAEILNWANKHMHIACKPSLDGIDVFAIIDHEMSTDASDFTKVNPKEGILERRIKSEMNLEQFRTFFSSWKSHGKWQACMDAACFTGVAFGRQRFTELNSRWAAWKAKMIHDNDEVIKNPFASSKVMAAAVRIFIGDVLFVAVPASELPNSMIKEVHYLPIVRNLVDKSTTAADNPNTPPLAKKKPAESAVFKKAPISGADEQPSYDSLDEIAAISNEEFAEPPPLPLPESPTGESLLPNEPELPSDDTGLSETDSMEIE